MKIFGIGTDIVNIKRMKKILKNNGTRFKNKIFSKTEINYCENKRDPGPFYAKRFAAKEAFSKALGTGIRKDISLKNIIIQSPSLFFYVIGFSLLEVLKMFYEKIFSSVRNT